MSAKRVLDAADVTKTYSDGAVSFQALRGVDFQVDRGEFVYLSGPSGSGKTTLLSILGCVLTATSGDVRLFGEDLMKVKDSDLPRLRLSYIGFIFQSHNLIASLTAHENVASLLELRGFDRQDALKEAKETLGRVGLGDKLASLPRELSGGQRQRVAIARALAGSPPLVLADEPTAALDAENGLSVTEMLKRLAKDDGHTVVVVTHDSRIFHLADRIVHIEDGKIAEEKAA